MIYFGLGLLAQAASMVDLWLGFNPLAYTAVTITTQMLLIGWLSQLGVALVYQLWLEPVELKLGASAKKGRGKAGPVIFVLFNLGLPLAIIGQPGLALFGGPWLGLIAALGGSCQLLAGLIFLRELWLLLKGMS